MHAVFGGEPLLPETLLSRERKAVFHLAYTRRPTRAFAKAFDGAGLDPELVDTERLRAEWLSPVPNFASALALQSAWLASAARERDATGRAPRVAPQRFWAGEAPRQGSGQGRAEPVPPSVSSGSSRAAIRGSRSDGRSGVSSTRCPQSRKRRPPSGTSCATGPSCRRTRPPPRCFRVRSRRPSSATASGRRSSARGPASARPSSTTSMSSARTSQPCVASQASVVVLPDSLAPTTASAVPSMHTPPAWRAWRPSHPAKNDADGSEVGVHELLVRKRRPRQHGGRRSTRSSRARPPSRSRTSAASASTRVRSGCCSTRPRSTWTSGQAGPGRESGPGNARAPAA